MLRHAESAPAEEVDNALNVKTLFAFSLLAHLAAMTCIRPGECDVF